LNEQLRWREDLTATLVHDMIAPLQGMISALAILDRSDEFDRETLKEMLSIVQHSATNLHEMTQLILDTNRLSAGQFNLTWEPLWPNTFLHEATHPLSQLLAENDQTLHLDIDRRVTLIWADRALLQRVIQNLVSNAIKFTPAGGTITVGVAPSPKGDQIEIRVRDSGQGIAPSALPYIFDRYYQARPGERRGVGLGLYFCRLAVEAHHGQIRAASQIGQGTTITIILPIRPPRL
jgi:signal transduction histidine kinase